MKKALVKLIIVCIGGMYMVQPGTVSNLKDELGKLIEKPIIQIEQELYRLINF